MIKTFRTLSLIVLFYTLLAFFTYKTVMYIVQSQVEPQSYMEAE